MPSEAVAPTDTPPPMEILKTKNETLANPVRVTGLPNACRSAAQLLDASPDVSWFSAQEQQKWGSQGRSSSGAPNPPYVAPPTRTTWFHEEEGVRIPMPGAGELERLRHESLGWHPDHPLGVVTARLVTRVRKWVEKLRGVATKSKKVTGAWADVSGRWRRRLEYLPKHEQ